MRKDQISPGAIVFPGHSPIAGHALLRQDADLPSRSPGARLLASRRPLCSPTSTGRGPRKARPPFRATSWSLLVRSALGLLSGRESRPSVSFSSSAVRGQARSLPRTQTLPDLGSHAGLLYAKDLGLESGRREGKKPFRRHRELPGQFAQRGRFPREANFHFPDSRSMTSFPTRTTLAVPLSGRRLSGVVVRRGVHWLEGKAFFD